MRLLRRRPGRDLERKKSPRAAICTGPGGPGPYRLAVSCRPHATLAGAGDAGLQAPKIPGRRTSPPVLTGLETGRFPAFTLHARLLGFDWRPTTERKSAAGEPVAHPPRFAVVVLADGR